jgi:large subunit ribosomal protein L1
MAQKGKRLGKSYENFDRNAEYGVDKAIGIVKDNATAKFDESVEIAMNLGVDPRHADQMVRGVVALPHGTGRDVRVAVFRP